MSGQKGQTALHYAVIGSSRPYLAMSHKTFTNAFQYHGNDEWMKPVRSMISQSLVIPYRKSAGNPGALSQSRNLDNI